MNPLSSEAATSTAAVAGVGVVDDGPSPPAAGTATSSTSLAGSGEGVKPTTIAKLQSVGVPKYYEHADPLADLVKMYPKLASRLTTSEDGNNTYVTALIAAGSSSNSSNNGGDGNEPSAAVVAAAAAPSAAFQSMGITQYDESVMITDFLTNHPDIVMFKKGDGEDNDHILTMDASTINGDGNDHPSAAAASSSSIISSIIRSAGLRFSSTDIAATRRGPSIIGQLTPHVERLIKGRLLMRYKTCCKMYLAIADFATRVLTLLGEKLQKWGIFLKFDDEDGSVIISDPTGYLTDEAKRQLNLVIGIIKNRRDWAIIEIREAQMKCNGLDAEVFKTNLKDYGIPNLSGTTTTMLTLVEELIQSIEICLPIYHCPVGSFGPFRQRWHRLVREERNCDLLINSVRLQQQGDRPREDDHWPSTVDAAAKNFLLHSIVLDGGYDTLEDAITIAISSLRTATAAAAATAAAGETSTTTSSSNNDDVDYYRNFPNSDRRPWAPSGNNWGYCDINDINGECQSPIENPSSSVGVEKLVKYQTDHLMKEAMKQYMHQFCILEDIINEWLGRADFDPNVYVWKQEERPPNPPSFMR